MDPKIEIELENPAKAYFPGEGVNGRVIIISTGDELTITEVMVQMDGRRAIELHPRRSPEAFYFFEDRQTLIQDETHLPLGGMLEYEFSFLLPQSLPSTFRASRASVEYNVEVTLRRKYDFDITFKSPFYVNGVLQLDPDCDPTPSLDADVGHFREEGLCLEIRKSKAAGCLSCLNFKSSHRYGFTAKLKKRQFIPGEEIHFTIDIWNRSRITLRNVSISIFRELRFFDLGHYHTILKEYGSIALRVGAFIKAGGKMTWESASINGSEPLTIPEDTPPTHLGCPEFINLNYYFQIIISPGDICSTPLIGKIPIIIGSSFKESLSDENMFYSISRNAH